VLTEIKFKLQILFYPVSGNRYQAWAGKTLILIQRQSM